MKTHEGLHGIQYSRYPVVFSRHPAGCSPLIRERKTESGCCRLLISWRHFLERGNWISATLNLAEKRRDSPIGDARVDIDVERIQDHHLPNADGVGMLEAAVVTTCVSRYESLDPLQSENNAGSAGKSGTEALRGFLGDVQARRCSHRPGPSQQFVRTVCAQCTTQNFGHGELPRCFLCPSRAYCMRRSQALARFSPPRYP